MIRLELERKQAGKSKHRLWMESGVDPSILSMTENRGFQMYPGQLEKVAAALGFEGKPEELLEKVD